MSPADSLPRLPAEPLFSTAAARRRDEPIGLLGPQDWLSAPETRALFAALAAGGAEVRFVGGCVRDAVARRPISDIDIATPEPPQQVMKRLAAAGIRAIPTGLAHGTVTAVIGARRFEITTLRVDAETFGRRARVEFTSDWLADATRRDFTFNALSADADGRVFDPFDGLADLGAGRVRFIGNADARLEEDALRLLRFFRFHAHYGHDGRLDPASLAACRRHARRLGQLSGERVAAEMLRLLAAPEPASVILEMLANAILCEILPEATDVPRLRQLAWLESRGLVRPDLAPDPLRRLAALLPPVAPAATRVANRLRLSRHAGERLIGLAAPGVAIAPTMPPAALRRVLYRLGAGRVRDLILLAWAGRRAGAVNADARESAAWVALLDQAAAWQPVTLPLGGRDVVAEGVAAGPAVGALLARLEAWWQDEDFRPDRATCLAELRRWIRAGVR